MEPPQIEQSDQLPPIARVRRVGGETQLVLGIPAIVFPTLITSASAFCGLVAINSAMADRFELSVSLVLLAAVFDCLDGQTARRLNCISHFGVELDSLVDFLSFGVAPGIIIYLWSLQTLPTVGFLVVALYVLCCAYRLARFNAATFEPMNPRSVPGYFQGVPAPAGAICALLPLMVTFSTENNWSQSWTTSAFSMTATALLMVSTIPTFSSKGIVPLIGLKAIFAAVLLIPAMLLYFDHWSILVATALIYIASVPVAITVALTRAAK